MNRNIILTTLFVISIQMICFSQFFIGAKAGYTSSWPDYGDIELPEDAQTDINGYNINVILNYSITKKISVGLEPGYVNRGAACLPGWSPVWEGDSELLINYIELPLLLKYKWKLTNKLSLNINAGYGASYLVSAYRSVRNSVDEPAMVTQLDVSDVWDSSTKRLDHGLYLGSGFSYELGIGSIVSDIRYYQGVPNIERRNFMKNRSLSFSVGYMIRI
ncbi:MAG: hypothetical protein ACI86M_004013 [Saprospiraceae bacterium]|jgi:hypothetical protein